jgi:hypothetical protein
VIGRDNAKVSLTEGGTTLATTDLWPRGIWEHTIETTGAGGRCTFVLSSSSLVHLSEFRWTRARG